MPLAISERQSGRIATLLFAQREVVVYRPLGRQRQADGDRNGARLGLARLVGAQRQVSARDQGVARSETEVPHPPLDERRQRHAVP